MNKERRYSMDKAMKIEYISINPEKRKTDEYNMAPLLENYAILGRGILLVEMINDSVNDIFNIFPKKGSSIRKIKKTSPQLIKITFPCFAQGKLNYLDLELPCQDYVGHFLYRIWLKPKKEDKTK